MNGWASSTPHTIGGLLTEGVERETFASYAAHTVPLTLETVPEELQDRAE
jgi:hypothetical protein